MVLAAAIGVPLAFLFARYEFPAAGSSARLVALPAVLPPLVGVIAFLFLYGETVRLARWSSALARAGASRRGGSGRRRDPAGPRLLDVRLLLPASRAPALAGLDASLLEAAASLGAGRWRTFRRVVLPLLRPALGGAALLTFMTSLASFSAPYIFGGGFRVMTDPDRRHPAQRR